MVKAHVLRKSTKRHYPVVLNPAASAFKRDPREAKVDEAPAVVAMRSEFVSVVSLSTITVLSVAAHDPPGAQVPVAVLFPAW